MTTLSERIAHLVKTTRLTKTAFAERINVSQQFVSNICSGTKTPSDRTIADICREFRVEERWLRTGEGEMFVQPNRSQLLADFMADVMTDTEDSARLALVSLLADLDVEDWEAINKIFKKHFQK